jgi:hypothetical protein
VLRWQNDLEAKLSHSGVMACRSILLRILEAARRERLIPTNPVRDVEAPKPRINPDRIFGHKRRRTSTPEGFGRGFKAEPKSPASVRVVPMCEQVRQAIGRQLRAATRPDDLVFPGPGGSNGIPRGAWIPLSTHNLRRVYQAAVVAAGFEDEVGQDVLGVLLKAQVIPTLWPICHRSPSAALSSPARNRCSTATASAGVSHPSSWGSSQGTWRISLISSSSSPSATCSPPRSCPGSAS